MKKKQWEDKDEEEAEERGDRGASWKLCLRPRETLGLRHKRRKPETVAEPVVK